MVMSLERTVERRYQNPREQTAGLTQNCISKRRLLPNRFRRRLTVCSAYRIGRKEWLGRAVGKPENAKRKEKCHLSATSRSAGRERK